MSTSPLDNPLRNQVMDSCREFLRQALSLSKEHFGSYTVPIRDVQVEVMEPTEPGHWLGARFMHQDVDTRRIYDFEMTQLKTTTAWARAKEYIQIYVDKNKIHPIGFQLQDIETLYLLPLFRSYLEKVRRFAYRKREVDRIIRELINHLDMPAPEIKGIIILEDFSAARSFRLGPKMTIRPISRHELIQLGRSDSLIGSRLGGGALIPRTDWWICEVVIPNPRGTAIGFNSIHDVEDLLSLSLRAFKPGGLRIGLAISQVVGPFGRTGQMRGGRLDQITVGGSRYSLSSTEITAFTRFWRKFTSIMKQDKHYLQVPIRRLHAAGTRAQCEDALVDYVVGIEALLGTKEEQTELGYRFRVRGAVLLAKKRSKRKNYLGVLRELYNLRSRIVHGQSVSIDKLNKALPKAESALRTVWRWYFDRYANRKDNSAGIAEIDKKLVGG